ncbi:MAG: hypothetical protein JOZ48_09595 [Acidobacteriaceae bacterium]|nr:hypothetical protein [Acidobacteriaceae bacterium]
MAEQRARAPRQRTGREMIKRALQRTLIVAVFLISAVYVCDYLVLRFRIATNRNPYGTVKIQPYYAVPQKDGKTQFLFDDPQDQTCVHSLFPHVSDDPCWYLSRNKEKRIDM